MVFRKKTAIVIVLTISLLWGSLAYQVNATDVFATVKFGLDTAAKAAAQGAFRAISNKILNKVKIGGPLGGKLFVQDWRDFQLQAQYRGEDIWRGILYVAANGTDTGIPPFLCGYIRNSSVFRSLLPRKIDNNGLLALNRKVDSLQEYLVAAKCDPLVNQNYDIFIKNFNQGGGWDTWGKLLQPQNNVFGALELAFNELGKQRKVEEMAAINEARAGSGFTGIRDCLTRTQGTSACAILGRIKTPGSTIGEQVTSVFDANLKFYTTADAASLAIAAFTEFIVGKMLDQGLDSESGAGPVVGVDPKEIETTYKSEFCSARGNLSTKPTALYVFNLSLLPKQDPEYSDAYQMFPPEEDKKAELSEENKKPKKAWDDLDFLDVGASYCKWAYDRADNKDPFTRCMRACHQKLGLSPGNNLIGPANVSEVTGRWIDAGGLPNPESTPTPTPTPTPGGGACRDKGGTADYAGNLRTAIDAVIAENPNGIADALNTTTNSFAFLNLVAQKLQADGLNATTNVKNGNDNPNTGDLIAVWKSGDSTIERYDAVINAGAGDMPMRDAATAGQFTGDIPLSCLN